MIKEYNFQEGLGECLKKIKEITERPRLISVYGWPNSGKSYLINKIADDLEKMEIEVYRGSGSLRRSFYEELRDSPGYFKDTLLIHCAWDRKIILLPGIRHVVFEEEDPNELVKKILNGKINLNIGIYNLNRESRLEGEYDLVISNPDSLIKKILN